MFIQFSNAVLYKTTNSFSKGSVTNVRSNPKRIPAKTVGGLSVSRFIIGTNWMAGWSHTGKAADCMIKNHHHSAETLCPMLETFLNAGIDVTDSAEGRKNAEHTIRDCDMVTVGCFNEMEAAEDIEISRAALERRGANLEGRSSPVQTQAAFGK